VHHLNERHHILVRSIWQPAVAHAIAPFLAMGETELASKMTPRIVRTPTGEIVTAKEIADAYKIPYELVAKVLQKLTK